MAKIVFVGILNITPDSFSDGGQYISAEHAITHAQELINDGAEIIDVGAESTNPRSTPLSAEQEIARLTPIMPALVRICGDDISLDTYHPETVQWAIDQGIKPIVNDVSGLANPAMLQLIVAHGLQVIVSHLPKQAGGLPIRAHTQDLINDAAVVVSELLHTAESLLAAGVAQSHIVLDPGIGFGKTMRLNWQLLDFPKLVPDYNVMLGYSRKRFLHTDPKTGQETPELVALKQQGGKAYETWLDQMHKTIQHSIQNHNASSNQTIHLRLHSIA